MCSKMRRLCNVLYVYCINSIIPQRSRDCQPGKFLQAIYVCNFWEQEANHKKKSRENSKFNALSINFLPEMLNLIFVESEKDKFADFYYREYFTVLR